MCCVNYVTNYEDVNRLARLTTAQKGKDKAGCAKRLLAALKIAGLTVLMT